MCDELPFKTGRADVAACWNGQRSGRRQARSLNAKGVIIFSNDGHFSLFQSRAEIPKIAANDRAKATREEAQSVVASSIAYYGTYLIDEKTKVMLVNLAASTYANVAAIPNQKRTITLLTSDELKFDNPRTPNGMTLKTTWKRAAAP